MLIEDVGVSSADCIILFAYCTDLEVCVKRTVYCLRNILESFLVDFEYPNSLAFIASLTDCSILLT